MLARTLKAKVSEQSDIFGALFTLSELGKDKKSLEALTRPEADRLPAHCQTVEIDLSNIASFDLSSRANPFKAEVDKGQEDADGEDPFRDGKGNGGLDLGRPSVEDEKLDGSKGINSVDGKGDDQAHPEGDVGEDGATALGLEVGEVDVVPFLVGILPRLLAAVSEAAHVGGGMGKRRGSRIEAKKEPAMDGIRKSEKEEKEDEDEVEEVEVV